MADAGEAFVDADGNAILCDCAVLFLDLLGTSAMSLGDEAADHLRRLEAALRDHRDVLSDQSPWPAASFSDSIVICAPLSEPDQAADVGGLAQQAAWLQYRLLTAGFFVRGGLTIAPFHLNGNLAFGRGLTEAYQLENEEAINPRIVLGRDAYEALAEYLDADDPLLRYDQEDRPFLDYLGIVLTEDPDADSLALLYAHREMVERKLEESRHVAKHWEKYRWVAEYHNAVCDDLAAALEGSDYDGAAAQAAEVRGQAIDLSRYQRFRRATGGI